MNLTLNLMNYKHLKEKISPLKNVLCIMLTWQMQIHVFYFLTFVSYDKYNTQVS